MRERSEPSDGSGEGKAVRTTPVFPLSNVVFFPHTLLPLHIFEPRYRAMIADAAAGDGLIAMVLARQERPEGQPPDVHAVGTVGRLEIVDELEDGRYQIVLGGLARVSIGRLRETPGGYLVGRLTLLGESMPDLQDPETAEDCARFLLGARRYVEQVLGGEIPVDYLSESAPYPMAANRAASVLRVGVETRQALLELDDVGVRAERVESLMAEQIRSHGAIERFSDRRPADPRSN